MTKLIAMVIAGAAGVGFFGSAQAYVIDWNEPYRGNEIGLRQIGSSLTDQKARIFQNIRSLNRMVGAWQSFQADGKKTLSGIMLQVATSKSGSVDLNIYAGKGVEGQLLSTTKLEWDSPTGEIFSKSKGWFAFKLDQAVLLDADQFYTIALENVVEDDILTVKINSLAPPTVMVASRYMDQAEQYTGSGPRGYTSSSFAPALNYVLLD